MQYTIDKAINLFKINKLNTKEKRELFEIIALDQHGTYYAYTLLTTCLELLNEEQRNICFNTLIKIGDIAAKYFVNCVNQLTKEERKILLNCIMKSCYALLCLFQNCCNDCNNILTTKEIAIIIKSIQTPQYYEDYKYYSLFMLYLVRYIDKFKFKIKDKLFEVMITNINFLYGLIFYSDVINFFSIEQKEKIYKKHSTKLFSSLKRSFEYLNKYCQYFQEYISDEEKTILVKKIINKNYYYWAKYYTSNKLTTPIKFPQYLLDQLNALLLMNKLSEQ